MGPDETEKRGKGHKFYLNVKKYFYSRDGEMMEKAAQRHGAFILEGNQKQMPNNLY